MASPLVCHDFGDDLGLEAFLGVPLLEAVAVLMP
jgi:hypothetical protein